MTLMAPTEEWLPKDVTYEARDPWEQQPDESDRDFLLFRCYRDLFPLDRTIRAAFIKYVETIDPHATERDPTRGRLPSWVSKLAATNKWSSRVEAYDLYCDAHERAELEKARINATKKAASLGSLLREKAMQALVALLTVEPKIVKYDDGTQELVITSALSPADIVKLAEVGIRIERDALGMNEPSQAPGGAVLNVAVFTGSPPREGDTIEERARIVLQERRKLRSGEEGGVP